jgi:hypothetical protein
MFESFEPRRQDRPSQTTSSSLLGSINVTRAPIVHHSFHIATIMHRPWLIYHPMWCNTSDIFRHRSLSQSNF